MDEDVGKVAQATPILICKLDSCHESQQSFIPTFTNVLCI